MSWLNSFLNGNTVNPQPNTGVAGSMMPGVQAGFNAGGTPMAPPTTNPTMRETLFGSQGSMGWLNGGMQVGQGLLTGALGIGQYRAGRSQMRQANEFAYTNLSNQAATVNNRLYDTYQQRYGGNAGDTALLNWGVSGTPGQPANAPNINMPRTSQPETERRGRNTR